MVFSSESTSTLPPFPMELSSEESPPRVAVAVGAAFGTSKAGIGIAGIGTFKPELIMKVKGRRNRGIHAY
jgi:hypothetical protein